MRALRHPSIWAFGELMDLPSVAALRESRPEVFAMLEVFAHGTVGDWQARAVAGDLTSWEEAEPALARKLRVLTVASLARGVASRALRYSDIARELALAPGDAAAVEDVLISAVQAGLVAGKIDQRASTFEVLAAGGRDVRAGSDEIDSLLRKLRTWRAAAAAAAAATQAELDALQASAVSKDTRAAAHARALEIARRAAEREGGSGAMRNRATAGRASGPICGGDFGGDDEDMLGTSAGDSGDEERPGGSRRHFQRPARAHGGGGGGGVR